MSPETIGLLGIALLVVLIALRIWIGVAMGFIGFIGLIALRGVPQTMYLIAEVPFASVNAYTLTVIPMFVLMGMIISEAGIGRDLFKACNAWLGAIRGGLSAATILASGLISAICGSHIVGTVILSKIALPEMKRYKYEDGFAAATVCAGAPISIILPPSIPLIVYGILTEQSVGKLFMSGIIPGFTMMAVFIALIVITCTIKPELGPRGEKFSIIEKIKMIRFIIPVVILFGIVIGGIYTGLMTTTESGAIGSAGAIVISLCYKSLNGKNFMKSMRETAMSIGMVFGLLIGTYIFIRFITYSKMTFVISNFLVGLNAPLPVMMLVLFFIYLILGMFIPEIALILLTVPILYPPLIALGFDPIWLGIYIVLMMALGAVTPPIGVIVFMVSGMSGVPVPKLFKSLMPFIIGDVIVIFLMCAFPKMATYIPSLM